MIFTATAVAFLHWIITRDVAAWKNCGNLIKFFLSFYHQLNRDLVNWAKWSAGSIIRCITLFFVSFVFIRLDPVHFPQCWGQQVSLWENKNRSKNMAVFWLHWRLLNCGLEQYYHLTTTTLRAVQSENSKKNKTNKPRRKMFEFSQM